MKDSQSEKTEQLRALHKSYAAGLPRELSAIELTWREIETGAVGTAGLEQLLVKVHSLAGSGGTFGFNVLSETALALMVVLKEAKQDGWSLTDEHHDQIRTAGS